jgi:hypothetical protein
VIDDIRGLLSTPLARSSSRYSLGSVHKVAPGANFNCPDLVYAIVSLTPVGVLNTANTYRANL